MMNKTINLFVVCPENSDILKNLKENIKKLCLELNIDFAKDKDKKKYKIVPVTYNDQERREEVGILYIKNKADIVIFLIDNERDAALMCDLIRAVKRSTNFAKPELLVYASDKIKENEELDNEIKQILDKGGWLYERIKSPQDLLYNVKERILQYIRSYKKIQRLHWLRIIKHFGLLIGGPLIIILLLSLAHFWSKAESRRLLIIGGGSARRYVEDSILHKKNGLKTLFWLYAPMPSGDSYRIMAEEIIKNYEKYQDRPYYPIVLSAQKASEKDFLRTSNPDDFKQTGIVVGVKIGYDWLVVYGSKNAFDEEMKVSSNAIRISSINEIIHNQVSLLTHSSDNDSLSSTIIDSISNIKRIAIYTTSENSGTLNSYLDTCYRPILREYLNVCDSTEGRLTFSDIDRLPKKEKDSIWIVLGSKYYHPKNKVDSLTVWPNNMDTLITKPIYVYFMLYNRKDNVDKGEYRLPKATKLFLEKMYKKNGNDSVDLLYKMIYDTINDNRNTQRILFDNFQINHEQ